MVGTAASMPPLNMTTRRGEIIGLDVDVARAMAEALNVQLRLVTVPFPDLLPALEAGKIDAVISGMTITPERSLRVTFVGPYFVSGKSLLAKADGPVPGRTPAELDDPAIRLAALRDSTSQSFAEQVMPRAKLTLIQSYDEGVALVLQNNADAMVADFPVCVFSVFRYPDRGLYALVSPLTREPIGIALPRNDPALERWTRSWLESLEASGALGRMRDRWFKDASWLGDLP
jgi:polar amino acid transport system substrate-binding protein